MDPAHIAWASGLFEGEGCIYKGPNSIYLKLVMTDKDVVERFANWAGYGKVLVYEWNRKKNRNHKAAYQWRIGKRKEVIRILNAMLPYFGQRRAYKALNVLDDLEI